MHPESDLETSFAAAQHGSPSVVSVLSRRKALSTLLRSHSSRPRENVHVALEALLVMQARMSQI